MTKGFDLVVQTIEWLPEGETLLGGVSQDFRDAGHHLSSPGFVHLGVVLEESRHVGFLVGEKEDVVLILIHNLEQTSDG